MCHWLAGTGLSSRNQVAQFGNAKLAPSSDRAAPAAAGLASTDSTNQSCSVKECIWRPPRSHCSSMAATTRSLISGGTAASIMW